MPNRTKKTTRSSNPFVQYLNDVETNPRYYSKEIIAQCELQREMLKKFDFLEEKGKHCVDWIEKYCILVEGENAGKIELLAKPMKQIVGGLKASGIVLTDGTQIDVDGVFCLRNSIAPTTLLKGLELDGAHVIVDRAMNTNIKGVFAAGDCTGRPYQIAKSVGEGNVAAHTIVEYLAEK